MVLSFVIIRRSLMGSVFNQFELKESNGCAEEENPNETSQNQCSTCSERHFLLDDAAKNQRTHSTVVKHVLHMCQHLGTSFCFRSD